MILEDFILDHVLLDILRGLIHADLERLSIGAFKVIQSVSFFHQNRLNLDIFNTFVFLVLKILNGLIQPKLLLLTQLINIPNKYDYLFLIILKPFYYVLKLLL